ncbi:MAG TPA: C4-type zinc ribbon domain-containing protein [Nitrospinota bacterium]|nr:C4-type zinc ribbon domain-containing protein [Nitrospinota bacterium]
MNRDLELLINLQKVDLKVSDFKEVKSKIPEEIEGLRSEYQKFEKRVSEINQEIEDLQKKRRNGEREEEIKRDNLNKTKIKLMEVKTNKEYSAILSEIQEIEKKISSIEDEILMVMELVEEKTEENKKNLERLELEEKRFQIEKKEKEEEVERLQQLLGIENKKREEIEELIDKKVLREYIKIKEIRHGLAVINVKDYVCQGCHVSMPPQKFNDIKNNSKIIHCSHCSRILYWED